jgi:putative membrane protein (TIGR04086 family)
MLPRLERRSVLTGALVTIVLAVPPAVIGLLLSEDDTMAGSSWVPVLFVWILVAFFVGGLVAARAQPHAPSAHGAAAALLGYVLVQGVGVARHLVTGEDLSWLSIVFSALLAASLGTVGGIVANGLRARRSRVAP